LLSNIQHSMMRNNKHDTCTATRKRTTSGIANHASGKLVLFISFISQTLGSKQTDNSVSSKFGKEDRDEFVRRCEGVYS